MTNEFTVVTAAATAVVGYNLFKDEKWKSVNYQRKISSISVVGSAAIGDSAVELWVGEARKGIFYNSHAGANVIPVKEDSRYPAALVGANQEVQCKVTDAPATNPLVVTINFVPAKRRFVRRGRPFIRNPAAYNAAIARNRQVGR